MVIHPPPGDGGGGGGGGLNVKYYILGILFSRIRNTKLSTLAADL